MTLDEILRLMQMPLSTEIVDDSWGNHSLTTLRSPLAPATLLEITSNDDLENMSQRANSQGSNNFSDVSDWVDISDSQIFTEANADSRIMSSQWFIPSTISSVIEEHTSQTLQDNGSPSLSGFHPAGAPTLRPCQTELSLSGTNVFALNCKGRR